MSFHVDQPRRGAAGRRRTHRKPFTEINIVPLTDVMLVLLIIFMVTAQFIKHQDQGMSINLPSASRVDNLDALGGIRVSVDRVGQMTVNGQAVESAALTTELQRVQQSPRQLVIVEGDRETVLQNVVTIMDAALAAGLPNVVLATSDGAGAAPSGGSTAPTGSDSPFVTPPPGR